MANNNIKKAEESNNDSKEFFSVREVAAMSGYSYGTVKRAIEQGNLAAYRIGRKFLLKLRRRKLTPIYTKNKSLLKGIQSES